MNNQAPRIQRLLKQRRGVGVVVVVLILAAVQLVVIGSVASSGDESALSSLRVDGMRGFYAGESGGIIGAKAVAANLTLPTAGTTVSLGTATVTFIAVPDPVTGGELTIDGASGQATRRIRVVLADPTAP